MTFEEILDQAIAMLQRRRRVRPDAPAPVPVGRGTAGGLEGGTDRCRAACRR